MTEFYHDLVTQKSFEFLKELKRDYDFVLIGGWAVFLYTRALKSKDVDLIVDYENLAKMKNDYTVTKNDRLKKYEIKTGQFDVDIYLPHYSELGIKVEDIVESAVTREGFFVPRPEILLLLKIHAWQARVGSAKGQKDEIDILSLAALPEFDWKNFGVFVSKYSLGSNRQSFIGLLKKTRKVAELGLNEQKMSRLRKEILKKI